MSFLWTLLVFLLIFLKAPLWVFVVIRTMLAVPETGLMVFFLRRLYPGSLTWTGARMRFLVRESLPLLLSQLCASLYLRIDQLFLNVWHGDAAVGIYAAAVNLVEPLWLVPAAFMTVLSPILASFVDEDEQRFRSLYRRCFILVSLLAWPIAFGGLATGDQIISLLYRPDFHDAGGALKILLFGNVFVYLGIVNNRLLVVTGRQRYDLLFTSISLAVNLLFNVLLIPSYGVVGAAWASLFAYATGPILGYWLTVTHEYSRMMLTASWKPFLGSLAFSVILITRDFPLTVEIGIAMVMYAVIMLVTKGLTREDREFIQELFRRRKS